MKQLFTVLCAVFAMSTASAQTLTTPQPSPTEVTKQNFGVGNIELNYSRPGKKSRKVMGDLVPYGKVWRTGANQATTLNFSEDVKIGGKDVKAGKYGLLSIPNASSWTMIITKDLDVTSPADYNQANDVARVEAKTTALPFVVENFTIIFANLRNDSCTLQLMWENTLVQFEIATNTDAKVTAQINKIMNTDAKPYYNAASYYYETGKDAKTALTWINKAVEANKTAFWMHLLKAKLHKKLGENEAAKAAANLTIEHATTAKNDDYIKMAKELLTTIK